MNFQFRCFILTLYCVILSSSAGAQRNNHVAFTLQHATSKKLQSAPPADSSASSTNELKQAGTALIRVYQTVISSQDKPACLFSKSCSNFAITAFERKGFFTGLLLTADRLQRCNELARPYYPSMTAEGKILDPVIHFYLNNESED